MAAMRLRRVTLATMLRPLSSASNWAQPPASSSRSSIRSLAAIAGSSPRTSATNRSASSRQDEHLECVTEWEVGREGVVDEA